jgi:hypothetical protein
VNLGEQWPTPTIPATAAAKIKAAQDLWRNAPTDWRATSPRHQATGVYMNYYFSTCQSSAVTMQDADGVFMYKIGDAWVYHPTYTAQCGLLAWGQWIEQGNQQQFDSALAHGQKLVEMQDSIGALRYPFEVNVYGDIYPAGFASAMAQGQALSLYARLYHATSDPVWLQAGTKALSYLLTRTSDGGVMTTLEDLHPSLGGYVFFEEMVTQPKDNYTLNGYMFTLLGLYDWKQMDQRAGEFFDRGIVSLERMLPYYDFGEWSSYDLAFFTEGNPDKLTVSTFYHLVHVQQLETLHALTGSSVLQQTRDKWAKYLDDVARVGG